MSGKIYSQDEYFEHLKEIKSNGNWAINKSKFTIFVGAGFSKNFNMPNWTEYAERKINLLKKDNLNINYETFEEMREMDPRVTLTIVSKLIDDDKKELEYDNNIFNIKDKNKEKFKYEEKDFCEIFSKINASFVTTNYDNVLEEYFDFTKRDYYEVKSEDDYILNVHDVFHIHGDIASTSSHNFMVRSLLDYYELYFQKEFEDENKKKHHDSIRETLKILFNKNEILIVGYGLSEIEILSYILENRTNTTISNITILYMKRKNVDQNILFKLYASLGINVIFLEIKELIDDDGKKKLDYSNLFSFLKRLAKEFAVDSICYDNNIYSLTRNKSFEIKEIIRENDDINLMIEAIDKGLFNINLWKKEDNVDGFVAINNLLLKFYKDIQDTKYISKIKAILIDYLTYDDINIYKVIDLLIPIYKNYSLLSNLVKKLNCDLILPNLDQNKIDWIVSIYIKIIENSDIDNNINELISVFINFVIMGYHNNAFQYSIEKNTLNKIIKKAIPILSKKCFLNTLAVLDDCNKNICEKVELDENNNYIKCIDEKIPIKNDFCYVAVSDLLKNNSAMNDLFLRRNNYTKLLNEYLKSNKDKKIVLSLINNESIYYKKIGLYYLDEYFDIDDIIIALSKITNYRELLNDLSISCILTHVIDKSLNKLNSEIVKNIKSSFYILEDVSSLETNKRLIRSYNYLKNKLNMNINLPGKYAQLTMSETLVTYPAKSCQNLSLIDDDFIIQNFKKSISRLNEIYLNNDIEKVSWYQEKNYPGTLQRIKEIANNNFEIDIDILDTLDSKVIGDIIDLIECKSDNYNEVITLLFSKLTNIENDEQNINKQINLCRGIDKYIDKCLTNDFKINYDILSVIRNIEDCRKNINLMEHTNYRDGHKYSDVYTLYINSITFILINLSLKLYKADENKIKELLNVILEKKDESIMIAALGANYTYFSSKELEINLKNILNTNEHKEIFFTVFISSLQYIDEKIINSVKFLFEHFINNELLCNDDSIYREMGEIIYKIYDYCDIYDSLLDDILKQYFKENNNFISIILDGVLSESYDTNNISKQKRLLKELRAEMDVNMEKADSELKMHCLSLIICNKSELHDESNLDFAINIIKSFDNEDVKKHEYEFYNLYRKLELEVESNRKINNLKIEMNKILQNINSMFLA